jgi:hypothetical protein
MRRTASLTATTTTARHDGFTPTCWARAPPVVRCCLAGLERSSPDDLAAKVSPKGNNRPDTWLSPSATRAASSIPSRKRMESAAPEVPSTSGPHRGEET